MHSWFGMSGNPSGGSPTQIAPAGASPLESSSSLEALQRFLEGAPRVTEALGEFLERVGTFEKTVGRSVESLSADFINHGGIEAFVRIAPPEIVAKFLQVMVRAARIGSPDLGKMTADQKIETGHEMKELARDLTELIGSIRAAERAATARA